MRLIVNADGVLHGIQKSAWEEDPCLQVNFPNGEAENEIEAYVGSSAMTVMARLEHLPLGLKIEAENGVMSLCL
jgi:hypothetical protein